MPRAVFLCLTNITENRLKNPKLIIVSTYTCNGGGVAQWLGCLISDQGVPGSNPGRCTFLCGLEQVTFTLLSTG